MRSSFRVLYSVVAGCVDSDTNGRVDRYKIDYNKMRGFCKTRFLWFGHVSLHVVHRLYLMNCLLFRHILLKKLRGL
jgi:hypothetical protein